MDSDACRSLTSSEASYTTSLPPAGNKTPTAKRKKKVNIFTTSNSRVNCLHKLYISLSPPVVSHCTKAIQSQSSLTWGGADEV